MGRPSQRFFGGYELLEELGRGAFGRVLRARQQGTGAERAVKILASASPEARERFQREVEVLARVDGHPNLVRIHEATEVAGELAYVMELVRGPSLRKRLDLEGRLAPREAAHITLGVARALEHCHRAGVLHRDVKPENVLLDEDGTPKLADLGLARCLESSALTVSGSILGTPHYMAPELLDGKPATPASNVYALGCVLFELVSGERTVGGNALHEIAFRVSRGIPPLRSVAKDAPADLELVCARALAPRPRSRYASAADLAHDLERFLEGKPIAKSAPSRRPIWIGLGAVAALGLAALAALPARPAPPSAVPVAPPPAPLVHTPVREVVREPRFLLATADLESALKALRAEVARKAPFTLPSADPIRLLLRAASEFPAHIASEPGVQKKLMPIWDALPALLDALLVDCMTREVARGCDFESVANLPIEGWRRAAVFGILAELSPASTDEHPLVKGIPTAELDPALLAGPDAGECRPRWRVLFYSNRARLLTGRLKGSGVDEALALAAAEKTALEANDIVGDDSVHKRHVSALRLAAEIHTARSWETHDPAAKARELELAAQEFTASLETLGDRRETNWAPIAYELARTRVTQERLSEALPVLREAVVATEITDTKGDFACRLRSLLALGAALKGEPDAVALAEEATRLSQLEVQKPPEGRGSPEAYFALAIARAKAGELELARAALATERQLAAEKKLAGPFVLGADAVEKK